MTLLPCPASDVVPYTGETVECGPELVCAHPLCAERWALERHHVVRRSELKGEYRWVSVRGLVQLNERRLCRDHHLAVTGDLGGHKAWIRHVEGEGWVWYEPLDRGQGGVLGSSAAVLDKLGGVWFPVGPLKVVL